VKLPVFSGGGNPSNREYYAAYDLLTENELGYDYDEIEVSLRWSG
jgi:hypothetical protein